MDEKQIRDKLASVMQSYYPDKNIRFAEDFEVDAVVEDLDDMAKALDKIDERLNSRWLGRFWRWYYRPRLID